MTILNGAAESGVNTTTAGDERAPVITKLADGYVVAWQSFDGQNDLVLQRYADNGAAVGGEVRINATTAGDQSQATIAATANGGFVVAWASDNAGGDYGVYLQRFDSQAQRIGGEVQANITQALNQDQPAIAALANGGFVASWFSGPGVVTSRVFGADGNALTGEVQVGNASVGPQSAPAVAGLAGGGYVLAWDGPDGIHAQRFGDHGEPIGIDARIDGGGGAIARPVVAALSDGGCVVAWQAAAGGGDGLDIYTQRFDAAGAPVGAPAMVNATAAGLQSSPAITAMPDGGYVVAWTGADGSGDGVFSQRFDAGGQRAGEETQLNTSTAYNQSDVALAPAIGGYLATWAAQEPDGMGWDVMATAVRGNVVPPLRSVVEATERSDLLIGTWEDNACVALGGDDRYISQGGSDWFDGGTGRDTFVFPESYRNVSSFTMKDGELTIHTHDAHNPSAVPIILNTERLEFSDAYFALDTNAGGNTWQAAALLQAGFGHVPTRALLSQWTAKADASASMGALGQEIINTYAHGISNAALVSQLYLNVTGHAATQAEVSNYTAMIGAGKQFATQGDLFAYAASTSMNTAHIADIVGSIQQLDLSWFHA